MLKHHKQHKAPTPQEVYRARKQKEEEERDAFLPPGLVNHGNTCFMNSTLQGLIATKSLHDLVVSGHIQSQLRDTNGAYIMSRRSPLLTNGHGVGREHEQPRSEGLPLGDQWLDIMQRAWTIQDSRKRESMSPKDLLTTIGGKYDQYLDFQQQDAHEFLRHLLDAMRMEEVDIIKKRQPPESKEKRAKRERPAITSPPSSITLPGPHEGDAKLESFVDMLFGGRLASILVCEHCKKVSVTREDFNDLSLSIKPEDYVKERKRDRFKIIAKKLGFRPKELGGLSAVPVQRASSVPASPIRRSMDASPHEEEAPTVEPSPRGSLDVSRPESEDETKRTSLANAAIPLDATTLQSTNPPTPDEDGDGDDEKEKEVRPPAEPSISVTATTVPTPAHHKEKENVHFHVSQVDGHKKEDHEHRDKEKEKEKEKEKDSWNKLGRRVSVAMKMGGGKKRLSRSADRHRNRDAEVIIRDDDSRPSSRARGYLSGSEIGDVSDTAKSRAVSPIRSALVSPPLTAPSFKNPFDVPRVVSNPEETRVKGPRPPKASREEEAYMRQILADVVTAPSSAFTLLHQALSNAGSTALGGSGSATPTSQNFLTKLGYLPGIEECLRLFTGVEVLDGENMVGCHRCWKIANGTYKPRHPTGCMFEDDDSDGAEERPTPSSVPVPASKDISPTDTPTYTPADTPAGNSSEEEASPDLSALSPSLTPLLANARSPLSRADTSVTMESVFSKASSTDTAILMPEPGSQYPGGLPIPSISTTAPESPLGSPLANGTPIIPSPHSDTTLADSLQPPSVKRKHGHHKPDDSSISSDEGDGFESSTSDASAFSDASSVASSVASVSRRPSMERLRSEGTPKPPAVEPPLVRTKSVKSTIPRSKQVIPRRMYKRYLVANPPPILVIHLKRFQQQSSRIPAMSFSTGFKKLDEFVAFPEYLDLTPYLVPKKEDFGLGKAGKDRLRRKSLVKIDKCMYRLYAVVVHIGNMLGGHYVSYTALPQSGPMKTQSAPSTPDPGHTVPLSAHHTYDDNSLPTPVKDKSHPARQWAYLSDTTVRLTTLDEVLKAKAYICMYERV